MSMKKLSLKTVEALVEAQAVTLALTELARHNGLFPGQVDSVAALATETLASLLAEHTKRTNEGRTEKLMKRIAANLVPAEDVAEARA